MFKFPQKYRIALVAPSGGILPETVAAGKDILEKCGNSVTVMPHVFSGGSLPHLAADDDARAEDINCAAADENIDIIWAVRGGAGALRILDKIDWELLKKRKIIFSGFSDITSIHWAMAARGINSYLAAPMMSYLAESEDPLTENSLYEALNRESISLTAEALHSGKISGTPLPGNIAAASSLCGTPFFPDTTGKILILEEVGELPYRIDRMLTQLRLAGTFERCAGIVFGNFTNCGEVPEILNVLKDFTDRVHCPVFHNLAFGHELPFHSFSGDQIISIQPR